MSLCPKTPHELLGDCPAMLCCADFVTTICMSLTVTTPCGPSCVSQASCTLRVRGVLSRHVTTPCRSLCVSQASCPHCMHGFECKPAAEPLLSQYGSAAAKPQLCAQHGCLTELQPRWCAFACQAASNLCIRPCALLKLVAIAGMQLLQRSGLLHHPHARPVGCS
jgi:hypothetical protein